MSMTRAQCETVIISRVGGWMRVVGMDGTTHDGGNADLADPIAQMLRSIGYSTLDAINPCDADFAAIPSSNYEQALSVATLFTMRSILGRFSDVDEWAGTDKQSWNDFGERVQKAIDDYQEDLKNRYGFGYRQKRSPRVNRIQAGSVWPNMPPPPASVPPWPPGSYRGPFGPSGTFNP